MTHEGRARRSEHDLHLLCAPKPVAMREIQQARFSEDPGCTTTLPPRVYWTMIRDLLDEALSFAVTLRSAPYEALDRRGRELLMEAASQLVESGDCVLDAIESTVEVNSAGGVVRLHPCLAQLIDATAQSRVRLQERREEIEAAQIDAPVWRLADVVADTRIELVQVLQSIAECYGPTRETMRRLRTYWDEHGHYTALAGRACRQLSRTLTEAPRGRAMSERLEAVEQELASHVESFEFGLLRQANRHKLHNMLERIRDVRGSRKHDDLAQRRLWNEVVVLVRRISEDQAARAM